MKIRETNVSLSSDMTIFSRISWVKSSVLEHALYQGCFSWSSKMQKVVFTLLRMKLRNTTDDVQGPRSIKLDGFAKIDLLICKYFVCHTTGIELYNLIKADYKAANLLFIT